MPLSFEPPLYTEGFKKVVLHPHESLVGWVGFYVNPESDDFELLFADDSVMLTALQEQKPPEKGSNRADYIPTITRS